MNSISKYNSFNQYQYYTSMNHNADAVSADKKPALATGSCAQASQMANRQSSLNGFDQKAACSSLKLDGKNYATNFLNKPKLNIKKFVDKHENCSSSSSSSLNNCNGRQIHLNINENDNKKCNSIKVKFDKLNPSSQLSKDFSLTVTKSNNCDAFSTSDFQNLIQNFEQNDHSKIKKADFVAAAHQPTPPAEQFHSPSIQQMNTTSHVLIPYEKLEELFVKYVINHNNNNNNNNNIMNSNNSNSASSSQNDRVLPSHLNTLSDQVASYIEELKDFIDERLIDTACQIEMANQRTSDLHMTLNYLISEISCLKYQNQELKHDLHALIKSSSEKSNVCCKCESKRSKSRRQSKSKNAPSESSAKINSNDYNSNNSSGEKPATNSKKKKASSLCHTANNNCNKKAETSSESCKTTESLIRNSNSENNYCSASVISCSVVNEDENMLINHLEAEENKNSARHGYFLLRNNSSQNSKSNKKATSESFENSFNSFKYKLEWPRANFNSSILSTRTKEKSVNDQPKKSSLEPTDLSSLNDKINHEAKINFLKSLIKNNIDNNINNNTNKNDKNDYFSSQKSSLSNRSEFSNSSQPNVAEIEGSYCDQNQEQQ